MLFEMQSNDDQSQRIIAAAQAQVKTQGGDQNLYRMEGYSYDDFRYGHSFRSFQVCTQIDFISWLHVGELLWLSLDLLPQFVPLF